MNKDFIIFYYYYFLTMDDTLLTSMYNRYCQAHLDVTSNACIGESANEFHFQICFTGGGQPYCVTGTGRSKSAAKHDAIYRFLCFIGGRSMGHKMSVTLENVRDLENEFQNLLTK